MSILALPFLPISLVAGLLYPGEDGATFDASVIWDGIWSAIIRFFALFVGIVVVVVGALWVLTRSGFIGTYFAALGDIVRSIVSFLTFGLVKG